MSYRLDCILVTAALFVSASARSGMVSGQARDSNRGEPVQRMEGSPRGATARRGASGDRATQEARREYDLGVEAMRTGHTAEALAHFRRAYDLRPNPVALISIASAQQQLGESANAIASLERYLHERPDAPDRSNVESRIASLRNAPSTVHVASTPDGAHILVDGRETWRQTPADITLAPGRHSVRVELTGHSTAERTLDLGPGAREDFTTRLAEVPGAQVATATAEESPIVPPPARPAISAPLSPAPHAAARGISPLTITAFAIAGAGLVSGAVFGGLASVDYQRFQTSPTFDLADRGHAETLAADVSFGVSIAFAATGLILYLVHDRHSVERSNARSTPTRAAVRGAPNGVAVVF